MPNIAKIVCGTRGGAGAGGAIKPSVIFTLIPGSPNAEFSMTMDSHAPGIPPQVTRLTVPAQDAALCRTLKAVSELEPAAETSGAYCNEVTLSDSTAYRVSYPQLDALISALWRAFYPGEAAGGNPHPFFASLPGFAQQTAFAAPPAGAWQCPSCGIQGQTGAFCTECGAAKPAAGSG